MSLAHWAVVTALRNLTSLICRIDDDQLECVPARGPLIIITNHISMLEIPIIYTHLQPRPVTGFVAAERWKHAWSRWLLDTCKAIPLRRGEADAAAIHKGLELLAAGYFVIVMPEGTRSGHGRLQAGYPGVVLLALHSGAAVLPIAFYGAEGYQKNLYRLRRTDFHIAVGKPFRINPGDAPVRRMVRQQMLAEVMYQIAMLLPAEYRGMYADTENATQRYLCFIK